MRRHQIFTRGGVFLLATVLLAGCFADGSYTVGTGKGQVKPATWLAPGGSSCVWTKTGPDGPTTGSGNGRQQVTVAPGDATFTTSGCGYWEEGSVPQTFTGTGTRVTDPFSLESGMAIVTVSHVGTRNFIVHLVDGSGRTVDYLVNEIGNFQGESASTQLAGGTYRLSVQADGPWTVTFTQPRSVGGRTLPTTFSGKGPAVAGPFFQSNRGVVFDMTHTGSSNFIVHMIRRDGRIAEFLANEIGDVDVSKIVNADGSYWLAVDADGPWTVSAHY